MSFQDGTVIVTGAGSGIGRATGLEFARHGACVYVVDIAGCEETAAVDDLLIAHPMDATDADGWAALVERICAEQGRIDALALVHGVLSGGPDTIIDQTLPEWERLLAVNLTAHWLGMQAVIPTMAEQGGGAIVVTTSGAALGGISGLAGYSTSKGGLISLVRQAAVDYARAGVRINAVAPGIVATPMLDSMPAERSLRSEHVDGFLASITAQTPLGRIGRPEDLATSIRFLASPDADFITGQVLSVDGGLLAQAVAPVGVA